MMTPLNLNVVTCSTRPGRVGDAVSDWVVSQAEAHGRFRVALRDLRDVGLPFLDEIEHPRKGLYSREHTKRWSEAIRWADALIFVLPEYNHGPPASLLNALSFLSAEWAYKPAAFVSYGGVSGGCRSVQATKPILTALKMMPIPEGVVLSHVTDIVGADRVLTVDPAHRRSAGIMFDELNRWAVALKMLRLS